jgi:hypothetical protein
MNFYRFIDGGKNRTPEQSVILLGTEKSGGVLNVFKQNHSDGKIFDVSRVGLIGSQPL